MKNSSGNKKIKYVKKLTDKSHYPTKDAKYKYAHACADKAEKKANPKMYKAENKAERHIKKHELMASHTKSGQVKIEKKFKRFTPTLKIHERTEFKKDPGRKGGKY